MFPWLERLWSHIPSPTLILIILCSGFCYFLNDGISFAFGIIYSDLKDVFENSAATTAILPAMVDAVPQFSGILTCPFVQAAGSGVSAVIGSVMVSVGFFVSTFVSSMLPLYFTVGVFSAFGLELVYVAALGAVATITSTHRGLAVGITVCCSSLGTVFFSYILPLLLNTFFWAGTFLIVSGFFLNIFVVAIIFYYHFDLPKAKEEENIIQSEEMLVYSDHLSDEDSVESLASTHRCLWCQQLWKKFTVEFSKSIRLVFTMHMWGNVKFLIFMFNEFIHGMTMVIPESLMYDQMISSGFGQWQAATVNAVFSALSTVGHLLWGVIGDKFSPILVYCIAQLGTAISIIPLVYIRQYGFLVFIAGVSGFFRGYNETLYSLVIIQDLGVDYFYAGLVVLLAVTGAGNMIGTPLGGHIFDLTHSYHIAFVAAGCILTGSTLILFLGRYGVDCFHRYRLQQAASHQTI